MKEDTKETLKRMEMELLSVEDEKDILEDEMLKEMLSQPAFEDPDDIGQPEDPEVYCNFSNGYGQDLEKPEQEKPVDKVNIGLMITASALCLGIIGVMVYWLVKFL